MVRVKSCQTLVESQSVRAPPPNLFARMVFGAELFTASVTGFIKTVQEHAEELYFDAAARRGR
jgi:hypothetical protein